MSDYHICDYNIFIYMYRYMHLGILITSRDIRVSVMLVLGRSTNTSLAVFWVTDVIALSQSAGTMLLGDS